MQIKIFFAVLIMMLSAVCRSVDTMIEKSPADDRQYQHFVLDNGLKVVVVSDPGADKAAVSLDVAVGSGTDPARWPGMAHFLEHMLFLGTEKYPQPGEYQAFIQQNGGHTNAFTAYDHTNYFYDIDPQFIESSLDRFAQFFISPLFTAKFVERERNAVDSEYYARRTGDYLRTWSARQRVFNPDHPITNFSIGNNQTLADKPERSTRDALIEFYSANYSSNIMSLAVIGRESPEQLELWIRDLFSAVPNHNIEPFQAGKPLYSKGALPKLLQVNTLKQKYLIGLNFALPEIRSHYKTKPLNYLSNLLGHEGKSSLLSYLKNKNQAESISAGVELNHNDGASFVVSIKATEQGFGQWDEIVASVMDYISMLREDGIQDWLYKELHDVSQLKFDYMEKHESSDYAVFLSSSLQEYPPEELLTATYLFSDYNESLIQDFVGQLNIENLLITLVSPEFESQTKTEYFNTPYQVSDLPEKVLRRINSASSNASQFMLSGKNPFIPENTSLKITDQIMENPVMLVDRKGFKFFYQTDLEFESPRTSTYVSIRSPVAGTTPEAEVSAKLYTSIVKEQLNEETYPATLTGLQFDVYSHVRGISIRITGFDDKQEILLPTILDALLNGLNESVFEKKKTELLDQFENEKHDTPYHRLYDQANDLLVQNAWPNSMLRDELKVISFEKLKNFQEDFFKSIEVIGLSHGNITDKGATKIANVLKSKLIDQSELTSVDHSRVVNLPLGSKTLVSVMLEHEDAAVVLLKQGQGESFRDKASIFMLYQLIEAPFFYQLRTVEQLGYIVNASPFLSLNTPHVALIIESPDTSVAKIIKRIGVFLKNFKAELANLSRQQFDAIRNGLIIKIDRKDDTLEDRSNRYWTEIDRENYDFDSRNKLIEAIKSLTHEEVINDYNKTFFNPGYGELIAVAPGNLEFDTDSEPLSLYKIVSDLAQFKLDANYFE